jgi:nitroimidazol reductase NimA-like FMN-containing flavoprotein (pyridoxamine 5'-phosphate oxidase superfamily)
MATSRPSAEQLPANVHHDAPMPWAEVREHLASGQWYWLATVRPDGRPHVVPLLAVALDDILYFVAGAHSRKARNLARSSAAVLTVATDLAHLVVEGDARNVRDEETLRRVADAYASKYGWQVTVWNGALNAEYGAPTAGPPPYDVYQLAPRKVLGFGVNESFSPTRWRF